MSPSTIDIELVVREVLAELRAAPAALAQALREAPRAVVGSFSATPSIAVPGVADPVKSTIRAISRLHARPSPLAW